MAVPPVPVAGGEQQKQAGPGIETHQVVQPLQRPAVGPVGIVQEQEQGLTLGEHGARQGFEKGLTLPGFPQGAGQLQVGMPLQNVGKQTGDFHPPGVFQRSQRKVLQPGRHRSVGESPFARVAVADRGEETLPMHPLGKFFGQARLADARLSDDQNGLRGRLPVPDGLPGGHEAIPRGAPPHQRQMQHTAAPRRGDRLPLQQAAVKRPGGGVGFDPQFTLQRGGAGVEDVQGSGAVSLEGVEAHQTAVGALAQVVVVQPALSITDGVIIGAALLQQLGEHLQSAEKELAQPLPMGGYPFFVTAGEQIAPVKGGSPAQFRLGLLGMPVLQAGFGGGDGCFEGQGIAGEGGLRQPLHQAGIRPEEGMGPGEHAAQAVEQVAQIGARLGIGGIGPEEKGQMLARLGGAGMQQQVGEQGLQPPGLDGHGDGFPLVLLRQEKISQQLDFQ